MNKNKETMQIKDWVEMMSRNGAVCSSYMRKLSAVETKHDMFRVLCDVNGGAWLFESHAKGVPMPLEEFEKEFSAYINGKKVMEYPQGYTSKFYCRHDREIFANTTLVYILESKVDVVVPKNKYPSVILSKGSHADIVMETGSRLNIETYGGATYNVSGDMGRVRVNRRW